VNLEAPEFLLTDAMIKSRNMSFSEKVGRGEASAVYFRGNLRER